MELKNTFEGGMIKDSLESLSSDKSYWLARNAIHESRTSSNFGLVNEESNSLVASLPGTIKGHSHIPERNQTLFFVDAGSSQLWLFNHDTNATKFVCADSDFGCVWGFSGCEYLYGEFKSFNACNELHVYWSSDCIYHVVNIDEMLDPMRKAAVAACEDCSYFDVFKATCGPHLSAFPSHNTGSTLEGGSVQFAVQFKDNDGNLSNVFDISQPVPLPTADNTGKQISTTSAKLRIDGLDKTWNDVIIYVIHHVGAFTTIKKMPSASYGDKGFTFEYYGQDGELVDISVLINKEKAYLRGQDLIQKDGRMFFYNIKNERNLNYQKYANAINVEYVEYEISMEQQQKYHYPSLLRGEVYALGIVWKYLDGTYSPVFHIPAGGGGGGGGSVSTMASAGQSLTTSAAGALNQYCRDGGGNCVECNYCEICDEPCQPEGGGQTGPTAGGGGSGGGGASDSFQPIKPEDLDTEDQFRRKRNPSEVKDRPNESDFLEEYTRDDIQNIDTREEDYIEVSECLACTRECWCCDCNDCNEGVTEETQECTTVDEQSGQVITQTTCVTTVECAEGKECDCSVVPRVVSQDIHDISNTHQNNAELMALYGKDWPDPPLNQTGNLHDAAVKLVNDAVIEREYITQKRPKLSYSGANGSGPGKSPTDPKPAPTLRERRFTQKGVGVSNIHQVAGGSGGSARGDNWVDAVGNDVTDEPPREVSSGGTIPWTSTVHYPDAKDCDGQFFYPQGPIRHHMIPWTSDLPHFVSFQNGVTNKYQPHNYEFGKTYVRPIGLRFSNIKFPDDDDLPKPLCPKSPYKIVYVKRTDQNKRIFAKGFCKGIFTGEVFGETHAYPRHGMNSFETVDRFIAAGDGGESRKGNQSNAPIYTFHSPDTDCDNSFLPVTKVKSELALMGSGWRHGLYAMGKEPDSNSWSGKRVDNRGARVSNNANHYSGGGGEVDLVGITYAPGNTVVSPASGMSLPLMNRFRESSVYMECSGNLAGDGHDKSFVGDVMDHFCPTECSAPYAALFRELPDQYGSVEGLKYIDLGLVATQIHAQGGVGLEGLCGDTWIGPYAKRSTSYVSNKVGNFFHPPPKESVCRERSWCDSPDDKIFQYFGIDHFITKLHMSGDLWDTKNYAGLHTVGGECGAYGHSKKCNEAAGAGDSETDWYWPRTLKSLNMTIVESHVNPWLRETGEGSQLQDGKVWYPKLKDLYLDADAPTGHPWEEAYLTRFYCAAEQPSVKQLAQKTLIRTLLNLIAPAWMLSQFQEMETVIDTVSMFWVAPMLMAFWILGTNTLFTDRRINQMFRIENVGSFNQCRRDEEGGDLDEDIRNWEDNYCRYNWDYSKVNEIQPYYAFPLPYNTCDCDDCSKTHVNNQIYHSNKQNLDSELDAYRNVRLNNYGELPGHAGKMQRMFIQGNGFYAHTTDGIWLIKLAQETLSDGIAFQQSGTGELLAEPQLLFEGVEEGFAGTQHPNAAINTSFGYFFVDDVARKIYRFNGTPEEISNYGMFNFFKENLGFCDPLACYDEKTDSGIHYALGWDPRHNRFLITKQDGSDCSSFTASYTPLGFSTSGGAARGKWISFHDYKPQAYLWDRNNFYSILYGSGEIWQHHKKGSYQTFYGQSYPYEVWFTAVGADLEAFDFEYLLLDTEAELNTDSNYPKKNLDLTFNKVAIWNATQGTGTLPIIPISDNFGSRNNPQSLITEDYSRVRFHKTRSMWRANDIKDLVIEGCLDHNFLISDCDCQVIPSINESLFNCEIIKKQDFKNRIISDRHLNYRYILDNRTDMRLYLIRHRTYDDKKQIPKQGV